MQWRGRLAAVLCRLLQFEAAIERLLDAAGRSIARLRRRNHVSETAD